MTTALQPKAQRALFVEDDPVITNLYLRQFRNAGLEVEVAVTGASAIKSLKLSRPDIVILDLMLPEVNGIEVLKFIRNQPSTANVPVIVFSNAYLNGYVEAAWKAGANKCLTKAFCTVKQLMDVVQGELNAQEEIVGPTPALVAEMRRAFIASAPELTAELLGLLKTFLRAEGDTAAVRPTDEGIKALAGLFRVVHSVAGEAGMAGFARVANMANALEAFLRELLDNPKKIKPSAARTVAHAADFLCLLFTSAATDVLDTNELPTVLVVDDENTSRKAVMVGLERVKFKATAAADPLSALEMARARNYDLIFLDVDMPGMDGFELCARLRQLPNHVQTPVVFVTILADFPNRARSVISGATDLIAKPFLPMELAVKAMTYVLKRRMNSA